MCNKNSHILLISPCICSFFFLSKVTFSHTSLGSYWSQCYQILCTPSSRLSVLCKWKKDAKAHIAFFFNFSFCHSYITHMDFFVRVFFSKYLIKEYENLCTPTGRQSVMCKWKVRCLSSFCFHVNFSFCHSYITHMDIFHQESQKLLDLDLWNH